MAFTYENVNPTLIPNTTMRKRLRDGVDYQYIIKADEGYALHDKRVDSIDFDENDEEIAISMFKVGETTVAANYDFDNVTQGTYTYTDENGMSVMLPVLMVGANEFYAVPIDIVPENQLMGDKPEHEIM